MQLNSQADCPHSMFEQLRAAHKYLTFGVFAFLACPSLLLQDGGPLLEAFKLCTADNLCVEIFRDVVSDAHACQPVDD